MLVRFLATDPETRDRDSIQERPIDGLSGQERGCENKVIELDEDALVLKRRNGELETATMRWGFPPKSLTNRNGWNPPIGIMHNLSDRWWREINRDYLTDASCRCLVPFEAFCIQKGRRQIWMRLASGKGYFASVWRPWEGDTRLIRDKGSRTPIRQYGRLDLFTILSVNPGDGPRPGKAGAFPIILTEPDDVSAWLSGTEDSLDASPPDKAQLQEISEPVSMVNAVD